MSPAGSVRHSEVTEFRDLVIVHLVLFARGHHILEFSFRAWVYAVVSVQEWNAPLEWKWEVCMLLKHWPTTTPSRSIMGARSTKYSRFTRRSFLEDRKRNQWKPFCTMILHATTRNIKVQNLHDRRWIHSLSKIAVSLLFICHLLTPSIIFILCFRVSVLPVSILDLTMAFV